MSDCWIKGNRVIILVHLQPFNDLKPHAKMIYHRELNFLHSSISDKIRYSLLCLMTNSCWCDCCFQHSQLWWIYLWLNQKKNEAIAARLLGGHKSVREQMARCHLERTVTDFRQQWSLRPETFWENNWRHAAAWLGSLSEPSILLLWPGVDAYCFIMVLNTRYQVFLCAFSSCNKEFKESIN